VLSGCVAARIGARPTWRDDAVETCVDRILTSEGRVSIAELAELAVLAGVGERRLQRRFAEVVGIAPRTLGVVVRLRRVFDALRDAPWSTWSERAQSAGLLRSSADGARLPPPARHRAVALGSARPGLGDETGRQRRLSGCRKPTSAGPERSLSSSQVTESLMRMVIMMVLSMLVLPHAARAATLPDLSWLSGDWRRCQDGEIVEERWLGPRGGLLIGANLTSSKGKASYENLRIAASEDTWTYWASPMGRTAVPFRMVESGARRAVFANPEHGFPARIAYWREGDELLARIEGTIKDTPAAVEWRFAKGTAADCPPLP